MSETTKQLLELQDEGGKMFESVSRPSVLKKNCTYIVSAVLLQEDKVLLISEAKRECYGQWYLPAGRVEKAESLKDAFKRELLEESSFEGEPDHLLSIDYIPSVMCWLRFNFIGHVTGGRLKTLGDADSESLEANWFPVADVLNKKINLRYNDILQIIRNAILWRDQDTTLKKERSLPLLSPHSHNSQKAILIDDSTAEIMVALCKGSKSYPALPLKFDYDHDFKVYFDGLGLSVRVLGLMSVEHSPITSEEIPGSKYIKHVFDGVCLNFLCQLVGTKNDNFDWIQLNREVSNKVRDMITKCSLVKINNDPIPGPNP